MKLLSFALVALALLAPAVSPKSPGTSPTDEVIFGFRDSASESVIEKTFLAAPDPKLAEEHLRVLTQAPHMAGTAEDRATADYLAQPSRDAALQADLVEYKGWMNN